MTFSLTSKVGRLGYPGATGLTCENGFYGKSVSVRVSCGVGGVVAQESLSRF